MPPRRRQRMDSQTAGSSSGAASSSSVAPRVRYRRGLFPMDCLPSIDDGTNRILPVYVDCGDCVNICPFCGALFWKAEGVGKNLKYNRCCNSGAVVLPPPLPPPQLLIDLYGDRRFMDNVRPYNMMFSMTSFGATVNDKINDGSGPYVFKVSGQICHRLGAFSPPSSQRPRFLQMYMYDTDNEVANRLHPFHSKTRSALCTDVVQSLGALLANVNQLVRTFKNARDIALGLQLQDYSVCFSNRCNDSRYDLPLPGTLGGIVFGEDEISNDYDIIVRDKSDRVHHVSKLHRIYMPLQYPLLFPYGETGWSNTMRLQNEDGTDAGSFTPAMFYGQQFHDRGGIFSLILHGGRLFQQYLVDAYTCVEHSRLEYIRKNQGKLRSEFLSGVYDAIAKGDTEGKSIGTRILLPCSFVGGPRYMYNHYQDALAICRVHGNPQYFITFTCNVGWPEINRFVQQQGCGAAQNRPDIIARVFRMKVVEFINFLKKDQTFGEVAAYLYTIEFQKRGLPHCHTLLWVKPAYKITLPTDIDKYISAELPDRNLQPLLYAIVTSYMVHGPCGLLNPLCVCMRKGKCKYSFPKPFSSITSIDDAGYAHYKRTPDVVHDLESGIRIDSSYIVPYNSRLSSRFQAHINVEYCGWNMVIKYLFKYISKGADRVSFSVHKSGITAPDAASTSHLCTDEIQTYVNGRYICPHEAAWRIFKFSIHERYPAVQTLAVHLPNMQSTTFTDSSDLSTLVATPSFSESTLTGWFVSNQNSPDGRDLTYVDYPSLYWWNKSHKRWIRRISDTWGTIGRVIYVPPTTGELFYLRMLLLHQKGCTSFFGIRTVSGVLYSTYHLACRALGLIGEDREWLLAFEEASGWATSSQLRVLFVNLILLCNVTNPMLLWNTAWRNMADDIVRTLNDVDTSAPAPINDELLQNQVLLEIQGLLDSATPAKTLHDFNLPTPIYTGPSCIQNRLLFDETNYDRSFLQAQHAQMVEQLNSEQLLIYNKVRDDYSTSKQTLLFVYGHGGTGKTFLWSTILAYFRSLGKVALAVAGSGIASLLLPSGRTAHSRFCIPIRVSAQTMCTIKKRTNLSRLLEETAIIIWDEATMTDRCCFECVDRSFRDILDQPSLPFGGISLLLGGDFRQTLPVKPKKNIYEVIASTLPNSYLWHFFTVYNLQTNMRLSSTSSKSKAFASWLLQVGNGDIGESIDDDKRNTKAIRIPDELLIHDTETPLQNLIDFVYPQHILQNPTTLLLSNRVIVCPKNKTTEEINNHVLSMTVGVSETYHSIDSVQSRANARTDLDLLYPQDYLNDLSFPGFPVHKLLLKIDTPVILLRNINTRTGLCNGTRLMVAKLLPHAVGLDVMTGTCIGNRIFIPKIKFIYDSTDMPFLFIRKQFPLRVCYAMTINKSQGQSLQRVGIYLPQPVFAHGQLYVALSRATSVGSIKMLILDEEGHTLKTTHNIVFKDLLAHINNSQVICHHIHRFPDIPMVRISEIDYPCEGDPLRIRLLRKWANHPRNTETWFIAVDAHGDAIQVFADTPAKKFVDGKLFLTRCYEISDYTSSDVNEYQRILQQPLYLNIGPASTITEIPDTDEIPTFFFKFQTTNHLRSLVDKRVGYPDFIGLYKDVKNSTKVTGEGFKTLILQDIDGHEVEFTLWKECSASQDRFDIDTLRNSTGPLAVAVSNVKTVTFNYAPKFTSSPATYVYINPPVPETQSLLERAADGFFSTPQIPHIITTIEDLNTKLFSDVAGKTYILKGKIKKFTHTGIWYRAACSKCISPISRRRSGDWFCVTHGIIELPKLSYTVTADLIDATAEKNVITPDTFVTKITGITCAEVHQNNPTINRTIVPEELQAIENKEYCFHLQLANKATESNIIYAIVDFTATSTYASKNTPITPPPFTPQLGKSSESTSEAIKGNKEISSQTRRKLTYNEEEETSDPKPTKAQRLDK